MAPYFNDRCFKELDELVKSATDAKVWAILTVRSEYGAGQDYLKNPQRNVFHNVTLRSQFYTMWGHVAKHYASRRPPS